MKKLLVLAFGIGSFAIAVAATLYLVAFLLNVTPAKASAASAPLRLALGINLLLLALFGVQHSAMAREGFKRRWRRLAPAPVERSAYVLLSGIALFLLVWWWQPLPHEIWRVTGTSGRLALNALFWVGLALSAYATVLIDPLELFGLRQVFRYAAGQPAAAARFQTPALYRYVRHPMMLGLIIAFWATPHMTLSHLVFAIGMTAYILIGVYFEEKDLVRTFGDRYSAYRAAVPMLLPWPWARRRSATGVRDRAARRH